MFIQWRIEAWIRAKMKEESPESGSHHVAVKAQRKILKAQSTSRSSAFMARHAPTISVRRKPSRLMRTKLTR